MGVRREQRINPGHAGAGGFDQPAGAAGRSVMTIYALDAWSQHDLGP
jgi:hypothetical protein